jgi:SAM-dependent methyltransferase
VLDLGCGVGTLTKELIARGFETWSADVDKRSCAYIIRKKINTRERTLVFDITKKISRLPKFKTIILADVLEHIEEQDAVLENCEKLLEKGGCLIVTGPYDHSLFGPNDAARGHVRRYDRQDIEKLLEKHRFKLQYFLLRNLLAVPAIWFAKSSKKRVPQEAISNSPLNSILKLYFKVEKHMPLPYGSEFLIIARKV